MAQNNEEIQKFKATTPVPLLERQPLKLLENAYFCEAQLQVTS